MKHSLSLLLLLLLLLALALTGCSSPELPPYETALADQIADSGAFSEPLFPLDADVLWMLYGLDGSGPDRSTLTDSLSYRSTGATCEEVCVLLFTDEAAAQTAQKALSDYLAGQLASNRDYRPAEIPKLEQAVLSRRGTSVLLLVAAHYDKAAHLLK